VKILFIFTLFQALSQVKNKKIAANSGREVLREIDRFAPKKKLPHVGQLLV
jgi:hypothetical protein